MAKDARPAQHRRVCNRTWRSGQLGSPAGRRSSHGHYVCSLVWTNALFKLWLLRHLLVADHCMLHLPTVLVWRGGDRVPLLLCSMGCFCDRCAVVTPRSYLFVVNSGCSISVILVIEMTRIVVPSAMAWPPGNDCHGGIGNTSSTKGFGRGGEGYGKSVATGEKVCGACEQCSYPYAAHPYDVDHDVSSTVSSDGADADLDMSCTSDSPVFFPVPQQSSHQHFFQSLDCGHNVLADQCSNAVSASRLFVPCTQCLPATSASGSASAAAPTSDIQALQQKHAQAVLIYHQTVEWERTAWQQLQATKASEQQMQNMLVTAQAHLQEVARMTTDAARTATALHHQLHQHQLMQLQDLQAQAAQQQQQQLPVAELPVAQLPLFENMRHCVGVAQTLVHMPGSSLC